MKKKDEKKVESSEKKVKKSGRYKRLIEAYKRRNRIVEAIIMVVILVALFVLCCNETFIRTSYTKRISDKGTDITIELPRFTYYVSSNDNTIVFKTLRKSTNTKKFFEEFLDSEMFDKYYCNNDNSKVYYYNSEEKYFIYDIEVSKSFAIKTIKVNYTTIDENSFCETVKKEDIDEE